ncbi:MAG: hypothetical protein J5835_06675 [Bacteroidales bacterium]|nr:hypothetical protein [Bacteroidales bacterium]
MKKNLLIFAASAMLASCSVSLSPDDGLVQLSVGVTTSVHTRAGSTIAGTGEENHISSIQVFVFKQNQGLYMLEAAAKADDTSVKVTVTAGDKDVLVLVNEPTDYTSETDRNAILSKVSNLSDNTTSNMVMMGESTCHVSTAERVHDVPVSRLASRVRLCKVTNNLANGHAAKDVKLSRVFLTSVAASVPYSPDASSSGFYATTGIGQALDLDGAAIGNASVKASVNSLIYKNVSSGVIADGASYTTPVPLYGYPNDGASVKTHLVAEMEIGGRFFTYPVELPPMERNCTCEITELVITAIGNPSDGDDELDPGEDDPITFTQATFSVTVQPWTIVPISNNNDGSYTI